MSKTQEQQAKYSWDSTKGEPKRPFRLWDAKRKCNLRWRNYADARRAMNAALIEVRWASVSESIEVYDIRNGRLLGVYTRGVKSISFTSFSQLREVA